MFTIEQLDAKVHQLRELKRVQEEISNKIKNLEDDLKNEMDERNEYTLTGDDWKITWNMVPSSRFSQSKFKEENPELFEQYVQLTESRRFLLK